VERWLQWRYSNDLESLVTIPWGRAMPPVDGARYWQLRLDIRPRTEESNPDAYWHLADRIQMLLLTSEGNMLSGQEAPGQVSEVQQGLYRLIPRNMGVYWSYGELKGTFYGESQRLPVSLLTALRAGFDWYGVLLTDVLPDSVPGREAAQMLDRAFICRLDVDPQTGQVFLPVSSVDSVGTAHYGTLGIWLVGFLKPHFSRWLGSPAGDSLVQDVVDTVHTALGAIPWVRDGRVEVLFNGSELRIEMALRVYGRLEQVVFTVVGSVGGGVRVE